MKQVPVESAPAPQATTWPIKPYLAALLFAWITLVLFTTALDGRWINAARLRTQAGICLILLLRLLWAVHRHERNRLWIVYLTGMALAAPLWILIEPWLFALARWWRGG